MVTVTYIVKKTEKKKTVYVGRIKEVNKDGKSLSFLYHNDKDFTTGSQVADALDKELAKLEKEGYKFIKADVDTNDDNSVITVTYIVSKEAKPDVDPDEDGEFLRIIPIAKRIKNFNKDAQEAYDIYFVNKAGKKIEVKSMKTVTVELKKIDTKNLRVFHENKDGKVEEIKFTVDGKKVTFQSDKFSNYYFVDASKSAVTNTDNAKAAAAKNGTPKTGDASGLIPYAAMLLVSGMALFVLRKKLVK